MNGWIFPSLTFKWFLIECNSFNMTFVFIQAAKEKTAAKQIMNVNQIGKLSPLHFFCESFQIVYIRKN